MKPEFVMLAHGYKPTKHPIPGWYVSVKLDGQRCIWDGGASRGVPKNQIPWANTAKDERYKDEQICTGLWSRYGNIIHASDWFLDQLPPMLLDGELYTRDFRQELRKVISTIVPDTTAWQRICFYVIDSPSPKQLFSTRVIDGTQYKKVISESSLQWWLDRSGAVGDAQVNTRFCDTYAWLAHNLPFAPNLTLIDQIPLPRNTIDAKEKVEHLLDLYTDAGEEGIMLRHPTSHWVPYRSYNLLKYKKMDDDEGTVVGYTTGRETALGSKLRGMMGALILDYGGRRLELSGFTEAERQMSDPTWCASHPGEECPVDVSNVHFPRGTVVTFRYRGKSKDGIPQEARYWRKREETTC